MSNKKSIIFVCNNLHIGGIQRSLLNLLDEISEKYDITLFLFSDVGEYEKPKNVQIICGNRFTRIMGMSLAECGKTGIMCKLWRSAWTALTRFVGCKIPFEILCRFQRLPEKYDVAVSFMQNSAYRYFYGGCNEFTVRSINADKKISFVHCDFENYFGSNEYNKGFYRNFDAVACVSKSCKKVFDRVCPELSGRTAAVHNCFNYDEMIKKAGEYDADYTDGVVNIFTSARISEEKGIFRMISIFESLKNKGFNFVWRVAGDGAQMDDAVCECKKRGLENEIVFLGLQKNPYPYFKNADLVLVPSYDEAAPMVFGEAEAFGTPVLSTETMSAQELVGDRKIGIVCGNTDDEIEACLESLLENPKKIEEMRYLPHKSNLSAIKEFDDIIC